MENGKLKIDNKKLLRLVRWFGVLAFCFAFNSSVSAQTEQPPKPSAPRAVSIPKPVERILPNGLRVIVVERKNVPLVTAQIMIKSGAEVDPQNLAGAADMTAELLTQGTKTRSASQIAEQIEFLGGSIDSGANWDFSSVTFRVKSDKLDSAMAIAADAIENPAFAQDEIDRLKTQKLDELSVALKQPGALASLVTNAVAFDAPIYAHPLNGTPESLRRIARADLVNLHQQYYTPGNAVLVVAGDIAPSAAFALAQKHFGAWRQIAGNGAQQNSRAAVEKRQYKVENVARQPENQIKIQKITVVDLPSSGQAAVSIAHPAISRGDKNYFQGIVANSILGGGYSARLNQEIRIKRGLSYGARSDLTARRFGGIFSTRTQTKNESAAEVVEVVINELDRLANEPVGETELTPRKAVLIGDFARDLETTNGLVQQIGELALYDLKLGEINSYIQNVQNVKDADARQFVKELLDGAGVNVVVVGDAKTFLPDLQRRFAGVKIETIPAAQLDLNSATLRKSGATNNGAR